MEFRLTKEQEFVRKICKELKKELKKEKTMEKMHIKQEPYVGEDAIYIPAVPYVEEGTATIYKPLITRELFVEAYNKWIKNATAGTSKE